MGKGKYRYGKYGSKGDYTKKYKAVAVTASGVRSIIEIEATSQDDAYKKLTKNLGFPNTPENWVRPAGSFVASSVLNSANVNSVSENFIDNHVAAKKRRKK